MGRWAQRRLAGGGVSPTNNMTFVEELNSLLLEVTYAAAIDATTLTAGYFSTAPGGFTPDAANQSTPNKVELPFSDDISAQTTITFNGPNFDIRHPQTIEIT